jgi:hypothetical protein
LSGYGGNRMTPIGTMTLKLHHKHHIHDAESFVVDGNVEALLGFLTSLQLNVVR